MTLEQENYTVKVIDPREFESNILQMWQQANPERGLHQQTFDWFFRSYPNPALHVYGLFHSAEDNHALIGIQAIANRHWSVQGENAELGNICSLVVDKKFRSFGPALKLVRTTLDSARAHSEFSYGFPNNNAELLFKRVGSVVMGRMVRYTKILDSRQHLEKSPRFKSFSWLAPLVNGFLSGDDLLRRLTMPGLQVRPASGESDSYDELWEACDKQRWVMGSRTASFINWRMLQRPVHKLDIAEFRLQGNDELQGYVAYRVDENKNFIVEDFLARKGLEGLPGILSHFVQFARANKARTVTLFFYGDTEIVGLLKKLRFYPRDDRPIYVVEGKSTLEDMSSRTWYMTYVDKDQ